MPNILASNTRQQIPLLSNPISYLALIISKRHVFLTIFCPPSMFLISTMDGQQVKYYSFLAIQHILKPIVL